MSLSQIEFQPDFPARDIPYATATELSNVLRGETLHERHKEAEIHHSVFRLSHPILNRALRAQLDDPEKLEAFSNGIAAYESAAAFMLPQRDFTDSATAARYVPLMDERLSSPDYRMTLRNAHDKFTREMPNTTLLVASLVPAVHDSFTVAGAAIAREVHFDTMNDFTVFEQQFQEFEL